MTDHDDTDPGPEAPPMSIADALEAEAWASHPGQQQMEARAPSDNMAAAVELALRVLRAANLSPSFGTDMDDVQRLWTAHLARFQPEDVIRAADVWVSQTGVGFPELAEFESVVGQQARERLNPAAPPRAQGEACPECGLGDTGEPEGLVYLMNPTDGGNVDVRPCNLCRPEQFALWRAGHFMPRHGSAGCHCHSRDCPDRAHQRARSSR